MLRVVSPSTLLRTVSLSNGMSNHLEFAIRKPQSKILLGHLYMSSSEQPKIVAFLCNWCAYAGADLAGVSRMQYPTNVRLIRLMCTGRVNHGFLLKAFLNGADGVLVSG